MNEHRSRPLATMSRRRMLGCVAGGGLLLAVPGLSSCGGGSGTRSDGLYTGAFSAPLYNALADNIPLILAEEKGYFREGRLQMEPISFDSGPDVMRSVATQTHLGKSSLLGGLVAFAKGFDQLRIVGGLTNSLSIVIIVKAESPFGSFKDLAGVKVGVNAPTSLPTYVAQTAARDAGLDPHNDLELVDAKGPSDAATALEQGIFDAVWSAPPLSTQLVLEGRARVVYDTSVSMPGFNESVLFSDAGFLKENEDVVRRWVTAIGKGMSYVRDNAQEAGRTWAGVVDVDQEVAVEVAKALEPHLDLGLTSEGFEMNLKACRDMGLLESDIKMSEIVAEEFGTSS